MTNHKWNILTIMRFYNRIGKDFNAHVYVNFVTPFDTANSNKKNVPSMSKVYEIIRRHVANGWCVRRGENLVITQKGINALMAWEKIRYVKNANVSSETLRRRKLLQD